MDPHTEDVYDMEFSGVSLKGLDKSSYVSYTVRICSACYLVVVGC
jgi:hypothetical protein